MTHASNRIHILFCDKTRVHTLYFSKKKWLLYKQPNMWTGIRNGFLHLY